MSEYWIHNDGSVDFADGDIGDYNHEGIVIDHVQREIINKCESYFDILDKYNRSFSDAEYIDFDAFLQKLQEAYRDELLEKNPQNKYVNEKYENGELLIPALKKAGVKNREWDCATGRMDARNYAMIVWGWKTYRNGNIDTWFFNRKDLQAIISGIEEISENEGWSDKKLDKASFTITVFSNKKHFNLTYHQLKNPKPPSVSNPIKTNIINYNTNNATKQVKDLDYQNIHPAYKRPGVSAFGDHTITGFRKFLNG